MHTNKIITCFVLFVAEYLQTTETRSNASPWIVAFSITSVTSIIFISTTLILIWYNKPSINSFSPSHHYQNVNERFSILFLSH